MQNNRFGRKNRGSFKKSRSSRFEKSHKRGFEHGGERQYAKRRRRNPYETKKLSIETFISKSETQENKSIYDHSITFFKFDLVKQLKQNIIERGYKHPTRIQAEIIPHVLAQRDVIGVACTGSGKTAAYLIPMLDKIVRNPQDKCLIVVPTRELANQVRSEYVHLSKGCATRDVVIMGGASFSEQIKLLKRDPHFVIATPGRLLDLYNKKFVNLAHFNNIVLDEVDEMLDMGFIHDVKKIISALNHDRQSLFFSATMSAKTEELAKSLLNNPHKIEFEEQTAVTNVKQNVIKVGENNKLELLHKTLLESETKKVLVFSKTKHGAGKLSKELTTLGHKSDALHGNKSLGQRTKVLNMFRNNEIRVLVATDVASRGIDIPDITHVINYDPPATINDYIHRVGRTGRLGKKGTALTFVP